MKSKLAWISFIPLFCAACFFKLAQVLLPEKAVFGFSSLWLEYLYLAAVALIFLFTVFFCVFDRKIAAYYLPHRNVPAGIIGLLSALLLAADGSNTIFLTFTSGNIEVLQVIGAVLSVLSAVAFTVLGLNQLFFNRESRRFSLLYIFPALMCAVRMIICFVSFTTVSVRLADVSSLICYVFAAMFFYYYAVMLSVIKTKNAVKYCFIFGFPAVAALIPYGVYHLVFRFNSINIFSNAQPLEMLLFGLFIFCFMIELSANVRKRDELSVVELKDQKIDMSEQKVDGLLISNDPEDENDRNIGASFREPEDMEGFLFQKSAPEENQPENISETDVEHYLTEIQDEDPDIENQRPKDYEANLDDIDRLILDISQKKD